jgi:hypothetical protein
LRSKQWILFLVVVSLLAIIAVPGSASPETNASPAQSLKAAVFHIVNDAKSGGSGWGGGPIHISKAIDLYDPLGDQFGHLFNISIKGEPAGYVVVGTAFDEYPIYEFSYRAPAYSTSQVEAIKGKSDKLIKSHKMVYMGPHQFSLGIHYSDGSETLHDMRDGSVIEVQKTKTASHKENPEAKALWARISTITPTPCQDTFPNNTDSDGVTICPDNYEQQADSVTGATIPGVPAWDQWIYYTDSNNRGYWTGCSPTAAADIMGYWQFNGYPNMGHSQMVFDLRTAMGTTNNYKSTCNCYPGATSESSITSGMQQYARGRGYATSTATTISSPSYSTMKTEVANNRPALLDLYGQTYYGGTDGAHTVTLVGYREYFYSGSSFGHQFMTIHDNWNSTPNELYVAYGRNYSSLTLHTFRPGN